jgi:hypothetical protein
MGGPQDKMRDNFYMMRQVYTKFNSSPARNTSDDYREPRGHDRFRHGLFFRPAVRRFVHLAQTSERRDTRNPFRGNQLRLRVGDDVGRAKRAAFYGRGGRRMDSGAALSRRRGSVQILAEKANYSVANWVSLPIL